jgi:hypothetical protein
MRHTAALRNPQVGSFSFFYFHFRFLVFYRSLLILPIITWAPCICYQTLTHSRIPFFFLPFQTKTKNLMAVAASVCACVDASPAAAAGVVIGADDLLVLFAFLAAKAVRLNTHVTCVNHYNLHTFFHPFFSNLFLFSPHLFLQAIPHLNAEMALCDDFLPAHQRTVMMGYYLATTQASTEVLVTQAFDDDDAMQRPAR